MSGRLGCVDNISVYITWQCGGPKVCSLESVSEVRWNRILDDISTAEVVIPTAVGTAGGVNPCCGCMGLIEPYCHELNIVRDGEVVWQGPVTTVDYKFNEVRITAEDVLGWTKVRVPQGSFGVTTATEITDIAKDMLENAAFSEHDPCVVEFIYQTDLNNRPTYIGPIQLASDEFPAFEGTVFDWLTKLNDIGLDFTTLGRRIILGVDASDLPAIGTLTEEHILGEFSVKKDGTIMGNRIIVRYPGDDDPAICEANAEAAGGEGAAFTVPCPAIVPDPAEEDFMCYGPIERTVSNELALDLNSAKAFGLISLSSSKTAPRVVEFPQGSKLAPSTPFGINELIPGTLIRVAVGNLCIPVNQVFKLTEVSYNLGPDGNEEVAISAVSPNDTGTVFEGG